ncbi:hypothetical protein Syun_023533 [Stephania yunnanensis]|uniref:Uncharacterized protein n=1 Tax=Stephania yunnanensis TaxID=152371 RepID=A0AAP0FIM2_9MAGN
MELEEEMGNSSPSRMEGDVSVSESELPLVLDSDSTSEMGAEIGAEAGDKVKIAGPLSLDFDGGVDDEGCCSGIVGAEGTAGAEGLCLECGNPVYTPCKKKGEVGRVDSSKSMGASSAEVQIRDPRNLKAGIEIGLIPTCVRAALIDNYVWSRFAHVVTRVCDVAVCVTRVYGVLWD